LEETDWKLRLFLESQVIFIRFLILGGMGVCFSWQRMYFLHFGSDAWEADEMGSCAVQPLTGKMYTQFSSKVGQPRIPIRDQADIQKYSFLSFIGVFELGSVLCGAAVSSHMLIVGRAVAGLGASGLMAGALTIIAAVVPIHKRPGLLPCSLSLTEY
jgi:MFS family permease